MSTFEQSLRLAGLRPREIVADGRIRRCATESKPRKRNGWYWLSIDGRRGSWGDNAVAPRQTLGTWADDAGTSAYAPSQAERQRQERVRAQERQRRIDSMLGALRFWSAARTLNRPHPYIADKGLSALGCAGLRQHDGLLVVPVWNERRLSSIQTIAMDGAKRFWPGAPVKAGAYFLDRPGAAITVFCEGLATGLAVYQSIRAARVVVCFDSGNLFAVADRIKPTGAVVIAADNDHKTMARRGFNPGIDAARNVADLIGCDIASPDGISGSDWADFLKEKGQGSARQLERLILAKSRYVARIAA